MGTIDDPRKQLTELRRKALTSSESTNRASDKPGGIQFKATNRLRSRIEHAAPTLGATRCQELPYNGGSFLPEPRGGVLIAFVSKERAVCARAFVVC